MNDTEILEIGTQTSLTGHDRLFALTGVESDEATMAILAELKGETALSLLIQMASAKQLKVPLANHIIYFD